MELSSLIKKLGHPLVEIRVRALRNIRSKLQHGLLSPPDLVQERTLCMNLLEWFNFPEVPMQDEALGLISELSLHPSGSVMLKDVGAVEFLNQLSPSVGPQFRPVIDGILDQLFHLATCPPTTTQDQPMTSSAQRAVFPGAVEDTEVRGYFQPSGASQVNAAFPRGSGNNSIGCLKFSVFPWLSLTTTDRHILSSNESSLRSDRPDLVHATCELLRDVIMQDFPSEIFLQRPSIVQSLLQLVGVSETASTRLHALGCLQQLCRSLRCRMRFHRDPSFCSAKHDPVSQNSSISYSQEVRGTQRSEVSTPVDCSPRPSVVGRRGQRLRGDGQDGDAASTSSSASQRGGTPEQGPRPSLELPLEVEHEDAPELQLQQWNLARFGVETLEHTLPLLRTGEAGLLRQALAVLGDVVELLADCVAPELWDEQSFTAHELRQHLQTCMGTLGDVLCQHSSAVSSDQPESSVIHHRVAYTTTAVLTVHFLQALLPLERAGENLPESVVAAVSRLCLDIPFSLAFPNSHEAALAYVEQASSDGYALYRRASRAAHAMEATCCFLKEIQAEGEKNWLDLLELSAQAVDGLPYHQHLPLVRECVRMCSYLWRSAQASALLQMESQKVLLRLLSHPLCPVKQEAYACTLDLVKECLGVHNVARPASSVCSGVHFLFHSRVLYEITGFGLQDPVSGVSSSARDVVLYLLKGRLMMTPSSWEKFTEALYPVIPVLQSYAGVEDTLGSCVLLLSELRPELEENSRNYTAQLRAVLRLLFTKHHTVRSRAVEQLLPLLTSATGPGPSKPTLDGPALSSLASLYVTSKPVDIRLDDSNRSYLKVESVIRLYRVLASDTVDLVLRRSAADQLIVVLQDTVMHAAVKAQGLPDKLISLITECVNGVAVNTVCLLEPSVAILRRLVYTDTSLRHNLGLDPTWLRTLLRASVRIQETAGDVTEAAVLMCLLLFDEVARVDVWTDKAEPDTGLCPFSLPVCVIRRYSLPMLVSSHHAVSPFCTVLPPHTALLAAPAPREALQVAWNRAWHAGTAALLEQLRTTRGGTPEFHGDLVLSESQAVVLCASDIHTTFQDCLEAVRSAGSHSQVTSALTRMHLCLLTDRLALRDSTQCSKTALQSLPWHAAVERFIRVRPACLQDEELLVDVLSFLNTFFQQNPSPSDDEDLRWLLELLLKQDTPVLLDLLLAVEPQVKAEDLQGFGQQLQRELTNLFNTLLLRLTYTSDRSCVLLRGVLASELSVRLLQCLRLSDAPCFYGLPSLEHTLHSMTHTTAVPGWSTNVPGTEPHTLCRKYLSGLLEVISSFCVEWGGNCMSFMGKGVTKNAVVCLLHLTHEVMAECKDQDWLPLWSLGQDQGSDGSSAAQLGLAWLIPLWVDRDPEVRCASLALGAALSSVAGGCVALTASCQNISGGVWATLLNILLDTQECSMVRREVAFVLQNLLVMPMPCNAVEARESFWQSPCVHDETSGLSLVGLPALQALLCHCHFFEHVDQMVRSCYRGQHAFSLCPPLAYAPPHIARPDVNDALKLWRGAVPLTSTRGVVPARTADSMSTSSTLLFPSSASETHSPVPSSCPAARDVLVGRLNAQGQSDMESSDSSLSQQGVEGPACVAIVTPHLLSGVCGVLANLVAVLPEFSLSALTQHHILTGMVSLVDALVLEDSVRKLKTLPLLPAETEDARSQVLGCVYYVGSVCKLLRCAALQTQEVFSQADLLQALLPRLLSVLTLAVTDLDVCTRGAVLSTWTDVLSLLVTLLRRHSAAAAPAVCASLGKHWHRISDSVRVGMRDGDTALCMTSLHFLCVLLCEEVKGRRMYGEEHAPPLTTALNAQTGEELCDLLLEKFEKTQFQDPLKKVISRALVSLLACSHTAQTYASKAGFLDACVEKMKTIHSQLQLESLKPCKAAHKKKEEASLKELRMVLELLRNCLYRHQRCKEVATELRMAAVLLALWPWLVLHDQVMTPALELLCVYTANCSTACRAVCGTTTHAALPRPVVLSSLMQGVMKLASQRPPDSGSVHSLAFSLLANLAVSRDSRGLLQKSNFLHHFLTVRVPRVSRKAGSPASVTVSHWLHLLLSVSYSEDGQHMIVTQRGFVELLADLARVTAADPRPTALLILHNLCFCSASKPRVLACDKAVDMLLSCLDSRSADARAIGSSALWALLHNNHKATATLKCPSVQLKVTEAYALAKRDAEQKSEEDVYLLKCLAHLTQLLST
ncbi:rotatin isoform X1 [Electrophorus electricus]|uniref:rotatin isoform X1 n=1 Tax=Electrophorus electricus TaxID=8005 RepID=UPI0015D0B811|nr:rotatin isoform X1 [Electrophorus electricus]